MTEPELNNGINHLQENFDDFFELTLCGFIIADTQGSIIKANTKVADWSGYTTLQLNGKKISDLLTIGGKIYYETHLWPLLRMQGFFDEVALELKSNTGKKLQVLVNAIERRDNEGKPGFIRFTILKASDRLLYEQNLRQAKAMAEEELERQKAMLVLREQLIAVLGHDLRNPLSAIAMATELLETTVQGEEAIMVSAIRKSGFRMSELVQNIMDFARTRMGEGIKLARQTVILKPVLQQVITELTLSYPHRNIIATFDITEPVNCDPHRLAQLLSNLLANALTHGSTDKPVYMHAHHSDGKLMLKVCNSGEPIPADIQDELFTPYKREERRPSQHGLGLGLYICNEIAKAHNATLSFISNNKETCFTFQMDS